MATLQRPDLHPPIIDFPILRPELLEDGYVFVAPYHALDSGPYIYDKLGNLIWSGAGWSGPRTVHAPRPCEYNGEDHLCFFTGTQHQGFSRGHGIIMDKHYRTVKVIESYGSGTTSDMHEFRVTPYSGGTSVLMTVYQPRQYDLMTHPKFNVKEGFGWIVEGVFQEIDIETGNLIFEWRSLDHVDPSLSWTWPSSTDTSGRGNSEWHPWDYFHLNSIDKNAEGDYLISARHVSAIYKLSGKNGSIIWQMGGNSADFEQDFVFSYQHHATWISENETHTVLSMYDNGANGPYNATSDHSHGHILAIDHVNKRVDKLMTWGAPDPKGGIRAGSQGNIQILPNGNAFIGWGEKFFYTEHTADGEPAAFAKLAYPNSGIMNYRCYKANWTGAPLTPPAMWSYSKLGKDKMVLYTSWNGDTRARSYNFFVSNSPDGPWKHAGNSERHGFETILNIDEFYGWTYSQALDRHGDVLGDSAIAKTFVPSAQLRPYCDDAYCQFGKEVTKEEDSDEWTDPEEPFVTTEQYEQNFLSTERGFNVLNYYHSNGTEDEYITPTKPAPEPSTPSYTDEPEESGVYGYPEDGYVSEDGYSNDMYVGSHSIVLFLGMVIGFVTAMLLSCLYSIGVFRRFEPLVEGVSRRAFGFKYQRVGMKDDYSTEDTGSSNSESIPL